jgi:chemotaxis family two-component system response regulator Rcp1
VFLIREAIAARHLNIDMTVFEDGEEAINLIADLDSNEAAPCPQLVLLDLNLPKTDGFSVLEALRRSRRCAGIPVIVMTSSAAQTDKNRSAALGANDYFQKPSGYDEFLKIGDIVARQLDEN